MVLIYWSIRILSERFLSRNTSFWTSIYLKPFPREKSPPASLRLSSTHSSPDLFSYLEKNSSGLLSLEPCVIETAVLESIRIKSEVVESDAKEEGERRRLNFGHTFGHALEKIYGISHGEAVSLGMVIAARISKSMDLLTEKGKNRILSLLNRLKLPTNIPLQKSELIDATRKDKKREGEFVHFVLLSGIGKTEVVKLSYKKLEEHIHDLCES